MSPTLGHWEVDSLPLSRQGSLLLLLLFLFFMFWLCHAACGILVPQPGNEPIPPALEAWSVYYRTVREVPVFHILVLK